MQSVQKDITFRDHTLVIGRTRTGKTYGVKNTLARMPEPVFFINTQYEDLLKYITATCNTSWNLIRKVLRNHELRGHNKINYEPGNVPANRDQELTALITAMFKTTWPRRIYVVIDEVHLFKQKPLEQIQRIATGGLRYNINGIFISQRPALVDNTIMTQAQKFVIYKNSMEDDYLRRYGLPAEEIKNRLVNAPDYSYVEYDFIGVTGPFKVK